MCQVLCSTLNNLPAGFQCVFQQNSTSQAKDSGIYPKPAWPTRPSPTPGTRWVTVQHPECEETFCLAETSSWSQRVTDLVHTEGVCPLSQTADPSPRKVKLAGSGKRGTGAIRQAQHPRPGFSALTPMATEKYLFPVDGLQWLLKPNTRPPSESQVIREIKIDPLHT